MITVTFTVVILYMCDRVIMLYMSDRVIKSSPKSSPPSSSRSATAADKHGRHSNSHHGNSHHGNSHHGNNHHGNSHHGNESLTWWSYDSGGEELMADSQFMPLNTGIAALLNITRVCLKKISKF